MTDKAHDLLQRAEKAGVKIATAESCTAGLISASITDVAGSSAIFDRGFVTYTNAAKHDMLDVSIDTLNECGAVSEQVAAQMAEGALRHSIAQLAVAVTGIAGPGGSEFKPEGRVCFAVAAKASTTLTETVEFGAIGRSLVRQKTVEHALDLLLEALHKN